MRTVPLTVAEVAVAADIATPTVFTTCGRRVGDRVELDLDALAVAAPDLADWADRYWAAARALWSARRHGTLRGDLVAVTQPLAAATQTDSKQAGRRDLRVELDALERYAGFRPLLDALLGPDVDIDAVTTAAAAWRHRIVTDANRVTVTLWVTEPVAWPAELGGPTGPGEVARVVTVTAHHAAWRDRKVRRLAEVTVTAEELWPAPQPMTDRG